MASPDVILNKDVFHRDPLSYTIPNDGVTKVGPITTKDEWAVARYELENFVCKGSYHRGLKNILESFLDNLDLAVQPAVWVSGFFGSGKSHLVRVLEFLWRDLDFPDGANAREICTLPDDVRDALRQFSTEGRRHGGIWSAAGTLSAGCANDPRIAVLQVVLRSARLPENIDTARVHLWLAELGILDAMRTRLSEQGNERDMNRPFVSRKFAEALIELHPDFRGMTVEQIKEDLRRQFGTDFQMTNSAMVEMLKDIFAMKSTVPGKLPLVLIVLDEVQQYLTIGEGAEQLLTFQEVVEDCCKKFGSKVLFVATGQEALQANILLQRLQGRFSLRVPLESKDVDVVLRQTILRKKESMKEPLEEVLELASGEISRHLDGSNLASQVEDEEVLLLDYPLLPTRKRFWERILQSVDRGGMSTQLRNQLRLTFDGARTFAADPVGTVIPADFIFTQQSTYLIRNNILSPKIYESISKEDDGTPEGQLRSRIAALLFLIQQVDESFGIRATPDTLADLLVTDLVAGSEDLRREVPILLNDLHDRGVIAKVGDEYRIQTEEGSVWEGDYQKRKADARASDTSIMFRRDEILKTFANKHLERLTLAQGESKTPRGIESTYFTSQKPEIRSNVPVWIRHEWEVTEGAVKSEAAAEGSESPMVMVFLPRIDHDAFKDEIGGLLAAEGVIRDRPAPTTPEGGQARSNIEAKLSGHMQRIDSIAAEIFKHARVYLGGGILVENDSFAGAVRKAADRAIQRMYYRFSDADAVGWDRVINRVKGGDKTPMKQIGFEREPEEHPVCKEILKRLNTPKTGKEVRKALDAPPFGWPRDAVDGALMVLVATGHLKARFNNKPVSAPELDKTKIGKATFEAENIVLSPMEKVAARELYTKFDLPSEPGREVEEAVQFLDCLHSLVKATGGDPPLPPRVSPQYLAELRAYSGNQLVRELVARRVDIKQDIDRWIAVKAKIEER
ncbi:MAG: BREX system P-loop protein BrxC, partial [Methanoculleus sp.]